MYKYPKTIENLISCYKKLPTIGEKTATRLALATLELDDEVIDLFSKSLVESKKKIKRCSRCNNITEDDLCAVCVDDSRIDNILCVVDDPKSIIQIEKSESYNGKYFVLNGLISMENNYDPDSLNISKMIELIKNEEILEVIIAVKPNVEGETTSLYISKLLEKEPVKVSRIALGIPIGADMDYVDSLTLELALENRKEIINEKI